MTYFELKEQLRKLDFKKARIERELNCLASLFIEGALSRLDENWLSDKTLLDHLVDEINQRDEPMSRKAVEEILKFSGLAYTEDHIEKCRPDSAETIREQMRYYAD